ncbi:MAG: transketolase family protein [Ruminiclostridium sp.]|nr:transketolase family protein [Ruminiclostridium sp.]
MSAKMRSTREAAGEAILELAREGADVVAISADTSKSMYIDLLTGEYPERSFDTGIAEQSMMMMAAGLASTGKIAFVASYSVFTSMRCCEQIRTFIAYPGLNVKIIAGIGGLSAGIEGVTHIATEDLGIMRCIANMAVIAPSDYYSTKIAVRAAAKYCGPVYIRVGRDPSEDLFDEKYQFEIGKPVLHKSGKDVTILACGLVLAEVFKAERILESEGIDAGVIEVHSIKPLKNTEIILNEVLKTKRVVTVEEHNVIGGLGSVVSELICGKGYIQFEKLGLNDCFAQSGTPYELLCRYNLDAASIIKTIKNII